MSAPSAAGGSLREREATLFERLGGLPSLLVAYSGGVDSAYLAWAASRVLGPRALAVTADSPSYPARHRAMALEVVSRFGLRHEFIRTAELDRPAYRANAPDRCYHCKQELYAQLARLAVDRGIAAVADGSNADDRGDYRPGRRAARELGVISPLDEAGLTKADIRALSREAGLPTWDEPASACLSSRIPYHSEVTAEKLRAIEQAEDAIRALGFRVVRVRHHGDVARIETSPDELARMIEPATAAAVDAAVRAAGFRYVAVDLRGYRLGSLNEGLILQRV
ncbi:MAG: ATP-dependent sacrificial sulfur transferase LarE [Acidobacteriota bacterium]